MNVRLLLLFVNLWWLGDACGQTHTVLFGPPIQVNVTDTFGNLRPKVVLTTNNIPLVTWGKNGMPGKVYAARFNGSTFDMPVQVNPAGLDLRTAQSDGPNIEALGDTVFITYQSEPSASAHIYIQRSVDGGITWTDTIRVDNQTTDHVLMSDVAIYPGGHPVVSFIVADSADWEIASQVSSNSWDGGTTFSPEVIGNTTAPGYACDCCESAITVKDSLQLLTFRNNDNNTRNTYVARSTDNGASYTSNTQIDLTNFFSPSCPTSGPASIVSGDSLVAFWMSKSPTGYNRIFKGSLHLNTLGVGINRMIDDSISAPITISQSGANVAGSDDTLALVWQDNRNLNTDCFISVSVSGANGFGLSTNILDSAGMPGNQTTPDIAYANGLFHVVYASNVGTQVIYRSGAVVPTGVQEIKSARMFHIYPNPTTGIVRIDGLQGPAIINVLDVMGRPVQSTMETTVDLSGQPNGVYFVKVGDITQKVLLYR